MKTFYFLLRYSKYELLLVSVAIIISGLGMTGLIVLINKFLRNTTSVQASVILNFFGICVLIIVSRIMSGFLVNRLMTRSLFELRMGLTRNILSVPLKRIEELGGNRILSALTTDTSRINAALIGFPFFLRSVIVLLCCLIYMALLSWQGFLMIVVFIVISVSLYRLLATPALTYQRQARREWDTLFGHFRSLVHGIKEFKLHSGKRADLISTLIEPSEQIYRKHTVTGATIQSLAMSVGQTMSFVVIGLLFFVIPLLIKINTQTLISFTFLLIYMFGPLEGAIGWMPQLMAADVAMDSIERLGVTLERAKPAALKLGAIGSHPVSPLEKWASLELRDATHTYYSEKENDHFTLGPINLKLSAGEQVFIVGGNGSGKTTLAKMLMGLYAPESGDIYLNGALVDDSNRERYCQYFSAVFSDFYLMENLLGIDPARIAMAQEYLTTLQLNHKVRIENNAFTTTDLSQGQRKRLALLVAYLEDRPIYVFDEWAADQDPHFKEVFYKKILAELRSRGKTLVVITHDDRYYTLADRVIKLESGRIV
ncbi:MAG TPA: cyclic peptide export ABC transporter [Rhodocyclaceae bacterium]|nr:cyclic peptide export ABC transporter [Rhodocyclaceae bacterium]